ncbi:MAG TPA: BlaB/IND/MUS family subclass B1 metallo-beta-lactamase [Chitinophagaceae bacterium]|jgi:metallo-beta-lactamase class B|nr:BlaB/IND/MUS family subclass B1 metallo-beta-lactamase [Chitinophagaceae bacterium]
MRTITIIIIFSLFTESNFGQARDSSLRITHLTGDFYVFTTYNLYKGNRIPANGMYVLTNKGAIVIDTPWDTTQFQPLLDSIKERHNQNVILCIATHFHEDRTAGLEYFRQKGADTYTTKKTDELSQKKGMKRAQYLVDKDTVFKVGQYSFLTYYPGPGHTPDNIVIWFEKERVLYGGCLVKSVDDNNLGNLSDASVIDYATTIKNVQEKCKNPKYIITGHNDWTNINSLEHTLKMAGQLNEKKGQQH